MLGKGKLLLSLLLLLSSSFGGIGHPLMVSAEGEEPMSVGFSCPESVTQGNEFNFAVYGKNIKGLAALTVTLYYPSEAFSCNSTWTSWIDEEWECTYSLNSSAEGRIVYSIVSMSEQGIQCDSDLTFFEGWIYARENAEVGAYRLELNVGEAYDASLQPISIPSARRYIKVEQRNVTPSLQTLLLHGYVSSYDDTDLHCRFYGDWCYDISAFRCSIIYDKNILSFRSLNLSYDMTMDGIYSVNSDTEGVIIISYASTGAHTFNLDDLAFSFKRSYSGNLTFHVNMDDVYDSSNNPVNCDPIYFESNIESKNAKFFINRVYTNEQEFYVDLSISEHSHIAAADLGLRFHPDYLEVSGIESKTGNGEMISFDRREETSGRLPFSYINVNGLEEAKVLARVYFRVRRPYSSLMTSIATYQDQCVDSTFNSISLNTGYYEVSYNFAISSLHALTSWDGNLDMLANRSLYLLKGDSFSLTINGKTVGQDEYEVQASMLKVAGEIVEAEEDCVIFITLNGSIILSLAGTSSSEASAYARRAQGFSSRLSSAIGDTDVRAGAFDETQILLLKALMKEYASYAPAMKPYVDPALCKNGLNVGETIALLRSKLNTPPKLNQSKLNFVVPMGGTHVAQIEASDDEDVLSYSIPALPSIGTVTVDSKGLLTFKGHRGLYGTEEFRVLISDGISTVTLPVKVVITDNAAPVSPSEKIIAVGEYGSYRGKVDVLDPDGDPLTYEVSLQPGNGTLVLDKTTGIYVYTPTWGYFGYDSFAVNADDGNHEVTQYYYVSIIENKTPKGESLSFTVKKGNEFVGLFKASDAENDSLTYSIFDYPSEGNLLLFDNGSFLYKPLSYATESDYFSVKVSDGHTYAVLTAKVSILA